MITPVSKKGLYTGGWILVALLFLGYSGFSFLSLFDPSFVGHSEAVKLASQKWRQFEEQNALAKDITAAVDLDLILSKFLPRFLKQEQTAALSQNVGEEESVGVQLPVLTGIIRFSDVHGNMRLLAVIEGNTYPEKAQVQGFSINDITEDGVVLSKAGIKRFVPAPEVHFSLGFEQQ